MGQHIYNLPVEFRKLACQAFKLSIKGYSCYPELVGNIVCIHVTDCNSTSLFVGTLFKLPVIKLREETMTPSPNLLLPDVEFPFKALIAHIESVSEFYLHKLDKDTAEKLKQLEIRLQDFYSSDDNHTVLKGQAGDFACVHSPICNIYCRVMVMECGIDDYVVQLVDYGHLERATVQHLLELPVKFLCYPVFSVRCQLVGFGKGCALEKHTRLFKRLLSSVKVLKVVEG